MRHYGTPPRRARTNDKGMWHAFLESPRKEKFWRDSCLFAIMLSLISHLGRLRGEVEATSNTQMQRIGNRWTLCF